MDKPIVSIIVPCYNYGHLLKECIESLFAQTYFNWECIIVDDGSIDNTKQIALELNKEDARINYFFQKNSGPTVARNVGLKMAKGEFIQFLDSDDLIEKRKFEIQLERFNENPECDIIYSGVKYFSGTNNAKLFDNINLKDSKPWMPKLSGHGEPIIKGLINANIMVINSPLVKRNLFEKFGLMDEALYFNEDWELWTRFAIGDAVFLYDESAETNALVRVHESYSRDDFKMYLYGLMACLKINAKIENRQYKKIMIPKINYHKRIIDEKLIELLSSDKKQALDKTELVYAKTNLKRYSDYTFLFRNFPVWFCYFYTRFLFGINKIKNVIIYA